ncbi:HNH endonuclease [compost metagenome]
MTGQELSLITSGENKGVEGAEQIQYQPFETLIGPEEQEMLQEFKNFYAHELADMSNYTVLKFLLEKAVAHKKKKLGLISKSKNSAPTKNIKVKKDSAPLPPAPKVGTIRADEREEKSGIDEKDDWKNLNRVEPMRTAISVSTKRQLWSRAQACCEHIDQTSKERCTSKFALEEDHIQPVALGGNNDLGNLQLLCRAHNSRRAIETFGVFRVPG